MKKRFIIALAVTALTVLSMPVTAFAHGGGRGNGGGCCGGYGYGAGQTSSVTVDPGTGEVVDVDYTYACGTDGCLFVGAHTHNDDGTVTYTAGHCYWSGAAISN